MKILRVLSLLLCCSPIISIADAVEIGSKCSTVKIVEWQYDIDANFGQYVPNGDPLPDEINEPRVLTVDSKGDIYVADPVNYRVLKFNKNGKFILKFSLQKPMLSAKPPIGNVIEDMVVDTHDNLYLINLYEYRIEIYRSDGEFIKSINYFKDNLGQGKNLHTGKAGLGLEPEHLGIDKEGRVFIYRDYDNKMALGGIYSPDGQLMKRGILFDDFGGTKKKFETRLINFSGYYLEILNRKSAPKEDNSIAILKNTTGNDVAKCTINIEPTTRTYIDKNGNVYFFEFNTLNIMLAKMI